MKRFFIVFISLLPFCSFSQTNLPVIQANSGKAVFQEQGNPESNWYINPKLRLDVYTTGKITKAKVIKFKTDVDSISFKIKPGQKLDFIVLLNGKDSCLTAIHSPAVKDYSKGFPEVNDTIPFFVNKYNTNFLPIVFNSADSLLLNFDTGATELSFTVEALKKVKSQLKLYNPYDFQIGKHSYKTKIYDIELSGNETDGLLGWNVFDGMIVELDYDKNRMIVHSKMPGDLIRQREYSKFKITYINNKPFIKGEISQSGVKKKALFLFDLGYQRTIMLDNDLLHASRFPTQKMPVISKIIMHGTRGNEIPVITASLEKLKIGKYELSSVPAQIMENNKPMKGVKVHYLGTDVLKRFNTILDFQNDVIYLKPNHHYNTEYAGQSKAGV